MRIEGTSALVAGGASGLGEATARALAAAGGDGDDRRRQLREGRGAGRPSSASAASFVQTDVTDAAAVAAAVGRAAEADGGLRISVCCAGVGWAERVAHKGGPHNLEMFTKVIQINLIGTFNVLSQAAAAMSANEPDEEGERGVCVNTASIAAFDGQIGQIAYSASKGGIVGHDPARGARPGLARGAGDDDRPGPSTPRCSPRCPRSTGRRSAPGSRSPRASAAPRSTRSWSPTSSATRC